MRLTIIQAEFERHSNWFKILILSGCYICTLIGNSLQIISDVQTLSKENERRNDGSLMAIDIFAPYVLDFTSKLANLNITYVFCDSKNQLE